jgi:Pro-kumamolisin, activation domain/Bacterial Ig-like domain (group 3)
MPRFSTQQSVLSALVFLLATLPAQAQPAPRSRILQPVDDSRLITLSGNTHPLARPEFDHGALADSTRLSHIVLLLQRSPEQETALQQFLDQQQDKSSSAFHQWLSPEAFGTAYGPSDRDLSLVTSWLSIHGFTGISINPARTRIDFSGTAGQVHSAFRTAMHRYTLNGREHFANSSDPAIAAALAPVVAGIASLNNFPRRAAHRQALNLHRTANAATQTPAFTFTDSGEPAYGLTPYDFATIYNVLPLWSASTPIDGTGQTIAIVGQTDINPADFVNFRKLFNLPLGNTVTSTGTQYLNIIYNGPNPGVLSTDEGEADIDTQWSAAVAKGATIDYVVSQSTEVMQGTDLSAIYIVDNNLAPVMSYSYGQCELYLGTSGNAFYKNLWQQAAAQGITVLVSSGDSGSAGCDDSGIPGASGGIAINGLSSTPYNISVGGTDFYMPNSGTAYWNASNDPATQASARGYIPEVPWNESCANPVFGTQHNFYGQTPEQVCNTGNAASQGLLSVFGGGGGPSSCTQSNGASPSSCRGGYAKPSWQTGTGVPADSVRDIPDVSLFASSGFFGAFYIVCQQSTNFDGQPCSLHPPLYDFAGYGGTSVSSPAFAGILALVNQKTGNRQGNANYVLYSLASRQNRNGTTCSSATGTPAAGCIFNDITTGSIAMPCVKGTPNCTVTNSGDYFGVLSGYSASPAYDLASGLGSVNAANLVSDWSSANFVASATALTLSPTAITHGSQVQASVKVTAISGTPTGNVSINALAANGSLQSGTLQNGSYSASLGTFPGGAYSVQAHYAGDGTYAPSDSNALTLTVNPENSNTTLQALLYNPSTGNSTALSSNATYPYGGIITLRAQVAGVSRQGTATGNIVLTDSGAPLDGGTFRLNSTSNTEDQSRTLSPGNHVIAASYAGDASFNPSASSPVSINISRGQTSTSLQAGTPVLSLASNLILTVQVSASGYGSASQRGYGASAPSGFVTFTSGGLILGAAPLTQNAYPATSSDSGSVTFTLPASQLPIGDSSITATYPGDINYNASTSPAVAITVTGATQSATLTTLTESATQVTSGAPYTFTATVASLIPPGTPTPTGAVTFYVDGRTGATAPVLSGVASVTNNQISIAPGPHFINAVYSGDALYQSSSSQQAFTVISATTSSTTTITLTPSTVVQGTAVSVAAFITPNSPAPTGTVQLLLDGNLFGARLAVTGTTTSLPLSTTTLQAGTHVLQVFYSGDSSHQANTSASAVLTILNSVGTFTLTPSKSSTTAIEGRASNPVTLSINPTGGFHSIITLSCSGGLPSGAKCLFAPSSFTPTGPDTLTTTLTISPASSLLSAVRESGGPSSATRLLPLCASSGIALGGFLFFVPFVPRRRPLAKLLTLLLTLTILGVLSGCGSGAFDPNNPNPGTLSAGSYAVTVTATGAATIQTATVNLTIH